MTMNFNKKNVSTVIFDVLDGIQSANDDIIEYGEFDVETQTPGFHDINANDTTISAHFSYIQPFEVEKLTDGMTEKVIMHRIKTCNFTLDNDLLIAHGDNNAIKLVSEALSASKISFEFDELHTFQNRMKQVKSISLANPKEKDLSTVTLNGKIDAYTEYNVIDPRNHSINKVKGVMTTSMGDINLTVNKNGTLTFGFKSIEDAESVVFQFVKDMVKLIHGVNVNSDIDMIDDDNELATDEGVIRRVLSLESDGDYDNYTLTNSGGVEFGT